MTLLPSWPTTPRGDTAGQGGDDEGPITAREKPRFWRMVRRVRRLRSIAWELREVVRHQHHVGGLQRDVGAGAAHRHADARRGQRRRIVHSITDHRHRTLRPQFLDDTQLLLRQQIGIDFRDPSSAPIAAATRWLSPVSITTRAISALSAPRNRLALGRKVSATADIPRTACGRRRRRRSSRRRAGGPPWRRPRSARSRQIPREHCSTDQDLVAVDLNVDPFPGRHGRRWPPPAAGLVPRPAHDRHRDMVLGEILRARRRRSTRSSLQPLSRETASVSAGRP